MTEKMPSEELVVELMTSGEQMAGGRPEALRLLAELRSWWGHEIANRQRAAHDNARPYFHGGQTCEPGYHCHVRAVIDLAEGAQDRNAGDISCRRADRTCLNPVDVSGVADSEAFFICGCPTTHATPPDGSGITPCCKRTPFELPRSEQMTDEQSLVTCVGT